MVSSQDILSQAMSGDRDALATILRQLGPALREEIRSKIAPQYRSSFDEDDVLSVTYCEVIRSLGQFEATEIDSLVRWIRKIAENNIRDAVRALNRDRRIPRHKLASAKAIGDQSYVCLLRDLTGNIPSPSRVLGMGEARAILELALAKLPADYGRVVHLVELEQRPVEQVAAILGRSRGAIYMLRARALDCLRSLLPPLSRIVGKLE